MRKIILLSLGIFAGLTAFSQDTNERYEFAKYQVSKGLSNGARITDIIMEQGPLDASLESACQEVFFEKDIIFDVVFTQEDGNNICRVYHLDEVGTEDIKLMFLQVAGTADIRIAPMRIYKFGASQED